MGSPYMFDVTDVADGVIGTLTFRLPSGIIMTHLSCFPNGASGGVLASAFAIRDNMVRESFGSSVIRSTSGNWAVTGLVWDGEFHASDEHERIVIYLENETGASSNIRGCVSWKSREMVELRGKLSSAQPTIIKTRLRPLPKFRRP